MSLTVWLSARTLNHYNAGGHFWVYLNWALGLKSLGCKVIWLELVNPRSSKQKMHAKIRVLKHRLELYGLADCLALFSWNDKPLSFDITEECVNPELISQADLLLNLTYGIPQKVVERFRRSALLDIDPGLTQIWLSKGQIHVAPHDMYFTIGETVGQTNAQFPDCGLTWHYSPPCVALDWWPVHQTSTDAPFTTVSNWYMDEWIEDKGGWYINDKRSGFLPYFDLPKRTTQPLELVLCLKEKDDEGWISLPEKGWNVRDSLQVTATPQDYQRYIQNSRGEFSCVKPSCIRLQNAWISDRTICYLASGKPAIVQHTGPSQFLPDSAGLFRFHDMEEAVRCLETAASDYEQQSRLARMLAEEYFDARKVVKQLLERALS
jgi:hypothetical protein